MKQTIAEQVRAKILQEGEGWVFTPSDFASLEGKLGTIERALGRLAESGSIRRLRKGLYYYPRTSTLLGELTPEANQIVSALQREKQATVIPAGAYAAHQAGLTQQVPARQVYWTDMTGKIEQAGNQKITFKQVSPKKLRVTSIKSGTILNAMEYLGQSLDETTLQQLGHRLDDEDCAALHVDASHRSKRVQRLVANVINTRQAHAAVSAA